MARSTTAKSSWAMSTKRTNTPSSIRARSRSLRSERDKSINIDRFVDPSTIDPAYFAGKTYYLLPNGPPGQQPYALLHRAMVDQKVVGLGQVVISNREQLVVLRPAGKLLAATVLQYTEHVKPIAEFEGSLAARPVSAQELKMAKMLIDTLTEDDPNLEGYRDLYNERLRELVDAKVEGRDVIKLPAAKAPPTFNLIDALKRSLEYKKARASATKAAPSKRKASTPRKRKTG